MSEITRQRHEERMAERRRGAGARTVTQSFGFDIPLIIATPPEVRARKAAEKRAILTVEEPPEVKVAEPAVEEAQRRRSGRVSRGSSVLSTPSALDSVPDEEGSARKRRRVSSSPARSVSSQRSVSVVIESSPDVVSNGRPTPAARPSDAVPATALANLSLRTPVTRSTSRLSPGMTLAPDASPMLSSPSPLAPRNSQRQIVPSSVSPEPLKFIPEIPSEDGITPEPATPVNGIESSVPRTERTGLRSASRGASTTPIPRSKRGRPPSSDKIQTPEKLPTPEPEVEEESFVQEEHVQETRPDTPPEDEEMLEINEPTEALGVAKPPSKRRGRKPKHKKQPSIEIPPQNSPSQEVEEEAILSDVEPEPLEQDVSEPRIYLAEEEDENVGDEVDEDFEEAEEEPAEEEEEESTVKPTSGTKQGNRTTTATRRPRQPGKSKRRDENGELKETLDITVYRIPKQGDFNFKFPQQPNNIQIAGQVLHEYIDRQLETLSLRKGEEKDREEKARMKIQEAVITNFSSALENRLIGMVLYFYPSLSNTICSYITL
ncbi:hypothetical protein TWF730_009994 [Orbilia blumenaviensis]|uniref:Uncharacterized protein n=1 Tax=Orbilia blumenaviensis TaxID=1796055 RepID=A0AAV9UUT9_9PEZI